MFSERDWTWDVDDALLATVIYADLFDFALDERELARDLVFAEADPREMTAALHRNLLTGRLITDGTYVTLPERADLTEQRRQSLHRAAKLWPRARHFGGILATIPFVRMVGVTGSLAADNPRAAADVDYVLIAAVNRLWLARAGAIAIVRVARQLGTSLCPNYVLATTALQLDRRDLYTAHELLQLVPLSGPKIYRAFLDANCWASRFLPHRARSLTMPPTDSRRRRVTRGCGEALLGGPIGERIDCWEWHRKSDRLTQRDGGARFTREVCEGHYGHYRDEILTRFEQQCERFGIRSRLIEAGAQA